MPIGKVRTDRQPHIAWLRSDDELIQRLMVTVRNRPGAINRIKVEANKKNRPGGSVVNIPFDQWVAKTTEINSLLDHVSDLLQSRHACVTPEEQTAVESHIEAARIHLVELRNELARELEKAVRSDPPSVASG